MRELKKGDVIMSFKKNRNDKETYYLVPNNDDYRGYHQILAREDHKSYYIDFHKVIDYDDKGYPSIENLTGAHISMDGEQREQLALEDEVQDWAEEINIICNIISTMNRISMGYGKEFEESKELLKEYFAKREYGENDYILEKDKCKNFNELKDIFLCLKDNECIKIKNSEIRDGDFDFRFRITEKGRKVLKDWYNVLNH